MRRMLVTVLISLLLVPTLPARGHHGWGNVKKLKPGAAVEVSLWTGENLSGEVEGVSDTGMQIATVGGNFDPRVGWLRDFDRANIRSVARMREHSLPNSKRWMIAGALAGGAVGVTQGAVKDAEHGNNGRWIVGGFAGAVLGFVVSCAALGVVTVVDVTRGVHRREIVYQDQGHPLSQTQ
jgi:hypothetical protein